MHSLNVGLLVTLVVGCGRGPKEEVHIVEPPKRSETRVRPPVIRIAIAEEAAVADLLDIPPDQLDRPPPPPARPIPPDRLEAYATQRRKTISELQPWRRDKELAPGISITDLHPRMHRSFLLTVNGQTYNLENRSARSILVDLDQSDATGLAIVHLADDSVHRCAPWLGAPSELVSAKATALPYAPICEDHLRVRNTVEGRKTTLEWATNFVRTRVTGGEHLADLAKRATQDRFRKDAVVTEGAVAGATESGPVDIARYPAMLDATLDRKDLGLPIQAAERVTPGKWIPVERQPGVYTSMIAPRLAGVPDDPGQLELVVNKDETEGGALVMLTAFDLDRFEMEFEVGTEHPGVQWSEHAARSQVDPTLPGPDGIGTIAPLGRTGQVPPLEAARLVASFIGGFKREHAAFKEGDLAAVNHASHYGVVQDGVVLSKLRPGLATLVVYDDGEVDILTWTAERDAELDRVLHARQNGIAPIRRAGDGAVVTPLIANWRQGNWSGSATGDTRTIRSGACIQRTPRGRYLLFGYFTAATPRTMARVFLAAGCTDAIHLDMNALEHTYMAVYERDEQGGWMVYHLDKGMAVLDKKDRAGGALPRFVAFADNRDFFTLLARSNP